MRGVEQKVNARIANCLPLPLVCPLFLLPLSLGAVSIGTLLLYFLGTAEMGWSVRYVLLPAILLMAGTWWWAKRTGREELADRIAAGSWAGALATFAYDVVRVPVALSGTPVFKAISYFGTVILDHPVPTVSSELVGWSYHFSNGVGFGIMYAAMFRRPRWWTAVAWGLVLEGAMLLTPYAEVFGYRISGQFLVITIGAHAVYGLALWAGLKYWSRGCEFGVGPTPPVRILLAGFIVSVVGVGAIAADFHARHAKSVPRSPPAYLGSNLYVTWDVLEPDRVVAMWAQKRFVNEQSRFHFIEPFSRFKFGRPFDMPEAEVRRKGSDSASEVLLKTHGLDNDTKLARLGRMTHLYEITPWLIPSDRSAQELGAALRQIVLECESGTMDVALCAQKCFAYLDEWYDSTR